MAHLIFNIRMSDQKNDKDFSDFISLAIDISMVIGPVVGYVYQYWLIKNKQALGTFSIDVCGILLLANITRLNFYIFEQYKTALFFQSILMVIVQLLLLQLCTSVARIERQQSSQQSKGNITFFKHFWRWPYFYQFLLFILGYSSLLTGISFLMNEVDKTGVYGDIIGLFALMVESILILPQIISNFRKGMVKGVSHLLLSLNLLGDIFKLIYFAANQQRFQFILCGITQVILDSFVISQIFYYRWKNSPIKDEGSIEFQNQIQPPPQNNANVLTPSDKENLSPEKAVKSEQPVLESNSQLLSHQNNRRRKRKSNVSTAKGSEQ